MHAYFNILENEHVPNETSQRLTTDLF